MKRTGEQAFGPEPAPDEAFAADGADDGADLESGEVVECVNVLPEDMRHLYDTVMVHRAPDGTVTEFRCAALKLHAASAMMQEAMRDTDTTVQNGRRMYQVPPEANVSAQALGDTLTFIHRDGERMPHGTHRRIAMLHALEWFDALDCSAWCIKDVVKRAVRDINITAPEELLMLETLPPRIKDALPDNIFTAGMESRPVEDQVRLAVNLYDSIGRVGDYPTWRAAIKWLQETKDAKAADNALFLLCHIMPPVVVAVTLAKRGMLTEERYAVVVETDPTKWTPPDYLALAMFTPLVEQRQPEKLRALTGVHTMVVKHGPHRYTATSIWLTHVGMKPTKYTDNHIHGVGTIKTVDANSVKCNQARDMYHLYVMSSSSDLQYMFSWGDSVVRLTERPQPAGPASTRFFPAGKFYALAMGSTMH